MIRESSGIIVIEDVPSSVTDEGMIPPFGNSFGSTIPIIEDAKTLGETPIEIHDETSVGAPAATRMKMQPPQYLKEPPYPE